MMRGEEVGVADQKGLEMLRSVPLFEGLSDRELRSIFEAAKEVSFPEGRAIIEEGASAVGFHLILEGQAEVLLGDRPRTTLGPGDYFGEMSLIDGAPRSATVRTTSPVRTLSLTSWSFMPLLERMPSIARKLLLEMSRRLRAAEKSIRH